MTQAQIDSYQPGGDVYYGIAWQYGQAAADAAAAAALTGDETKVNAALVNARYGSPLNTSTASLFLNQITTDPFAAPLASANNVLSNTFSALFKSPAVLLVLVAVLFIYLGGLNVARKHFEK